MWYERPANAQTSRNKCKFTPNCVAAELLPLLAYTFPHGPWREKFCLWEFASNKGVDQPAHTHSLISTFVIRYLESTISRFASSEISSF